MVTPASVLLGAFEAQGRGVEREPAQEFGQSALDLWAALREAVEKGPAGVDLRHVRGSARDVSERVRTPPKQPP